MQHRSPTGSLEVVPLKDEGEFHPVSSESAAGSVEALRQLHRVFSHML